MNDLDKIKFVDSLNLFFDKHAFCWDELHEDDIEYIDTPFKQDDSYHNRYEICYEFDEREGDETKI